MSQMLYNVHCLSWPLEGPKSLSPLVARSPRYIPQSNYLSWWFHIVGAWCLVQQGIDLSGPPVHFCGRPWLRGWLESVYSPHSWGSSPNGSPSLLFLEAPESSCSWGLSWGSLLLQWKPWKGFHPWWGDQRASQGQSSQPPTSLNQPLSSSSSQVGGHSLSWAVA